jgi:beta-aspartyl-dipeptidase (metallo-type)
MELLWRIVEETEIPITQMYPTHMGGRGEALLAEGLKWIQRGGTIDLTCGDKTPQAIKSLVEGGAKLSNITISSDAYGIVFKDPI